MIDYLNAVPQARVELDRYADEAISIVTRIEVLIGADSDQESGTRESLSTFDVVAPDAQVAERAIGWRRLHRIKLPDAVIWATARAHAMLLVTRNTKDFPTGDPGVRAPYAL